MSLTSLVVFNSGGGMRRRLGPGACGARPRLPALERTVPPRHWGGQLTPATRPALRLPGPRRSEACRYRGTRQRLWPRSSAISSGEPANQTTEHQTQFRTERHVGDHAHEGTQSQPDDSAERDCGTDAHPAHATPTAPRLRGLQPRCRTSASGRSCPGRTRRRARLSSQRGHRRPCRCRGSEQRP